MGSMFGGGTSNTGGNTSQVNTGPSAFQSPYLSGLYSDTNATLNNQLNEPAPFTAANLYAADNGLELTGAGNLYNNGQATANYAPGTMQAGYGALSGLPTAGNTGTNFASGMFNQGSTMGGSAAVGAVPMSTMAGLGGLNGAASQIAANNPAALASGAGQMINNPVLQGQIDAVGTDISRNLNQSTLPQLNATAMSNGNMDSTRAGVAQGIDESQANENLANAAAQIRGSAYNQGLSLAAGQNATNISGSLGTTSAATGMTNAGLYGLSADNAQVNANNSAMLQGTNVLDQQAALGSGLLTAGSALGQSGASQMYQGGQIAQQNAQNTMNANVQAFQMANQQPWTALSNASGIFQQQNYGQSGTTAGTQQTQQTQSDSGLADIASIAAIAAMFA